MPTTDFHFCDLGIRLLGYFKVGLESRPKKIIDIVTAVIVR